MAPFLIILGLFILAFLGFLVGNYNNLVQFRNQVKNAWAQIDVQLKRRHDLIPNLVETVKGYAKHERETLENLTRARSMAVDAKGVKDISRAEGELSHAISRLMLVMENYPDLKANQNFLALQEELSSTENKVAFSRQAYNDQVLFYNNKIQMFPSNIIAGMFSFQQEEFFEIENKAEREAPRVNLS
jgi:LemA protein